MSGKLELILGGMFSGKSTEIIRKIRLLQNKGKKVLVIKPVIDSRYISNKITTHNFESVECVVLNRLDEISDENLLKYYTVVVDEGQFFIDLFDTISRWIDNFPINIIVGGLDGDFKRNPMGQMLNLIPIADYYQKFVSYCNICEDCVDAPFSFRLNKSTDTVFVGGSESYIPVCRKHYTELTKTQIELS